MKVTDVKMENYRWDRAKPIRNGRYVYPTAGLNVVKVETDEGVTGVGLSGGVQEAPDIGRSITCSSTCCRRSTWTMRSSRPRSPRGNGV